MSNGHNRDYEAGVDREIHIKGIVVTGVVLALIIATSAALMLWMSRGLRASMEGRDPAPPVLLEARIQEQPPEPRLQTSPEEDLVQMRSEESAALDKYAWVDEAAGVARVPIERAMEILAAGGLPEAAPTEPAEPGAAVDDQPEPAAAEGDAGE